MEVEEAVSGQHGPSLAVPSSGHTQCLGVETKGAGQAAAEEGWMMNSATEIVAVVVADAIYWTTSD